ncbi:FHA domain-containing protein PS1-like [Salvia miltiorrhiza]|uniref:FHA domain-containing protein PS1-like n=1 Tax=Salvia miltiorrhiza TaxID=226208 RepID=UPI0025AC5CC8|nr:FHA domain-containing protein PS1-like [Salvia miltiorrhiza]
MAENQEQVRPKEREIPVFTVLKNNCILKNIFVLDNPPPISSSSSAEISGQESEREEILLVGRHPDCNIKLEHPSISRFHLRIHSMPSSRSLFVTDLSSVHGTCISGKRIEPGVTMELVPGDTLKLGESSRLYRLDWVPISFAYDINDPFVPQPDTLDTVDEETEGADQDENRLSRENEWGWDLSDEIEALGWQETTAEVENTRLPEMLSNENEITGSQLLLLDVSLSADEETEGATEQVKMLSNENEITGSQLLSLDVSLSADEETEGATEQDGDSLLHDLGEVMEDRPFCDEATTPPLPEDEASSPQIREEENEFYSSQLCQVEKENSPQLEDEVESMPEICINKNDFLRSIPLAETVEAFERNSEKRLGMNIWSRRGKSEGVKIRTSRSKATCGIENCVSKSMLKDQCDASPDKDEEIFTPDKENASPDSCLVRSLRGKFNETLKSESMSDEDEEVFTSDKENMTPNSHLLRSIKNVGSSQEVRHLNFHKPSPLKTVSRGILQERKPASSASKSHCSLKKQPPCVMKAAEREPFLLLPVISTGDDKPTPIPSAHEGTMRKSRCIDYSKVSGNRWIIVVDTACLLNKKSRRELQLLRGLRGTSLVIPRIVLRELDCMVRRASFLSRMTEASAALQWIEECMASSTWWIHVQSSAEESRLVPPTPPAAASAHWFGEEKGAFSVGSIPFSPYSLQEIVTPTAADHILESALFFKQAMNGHLVLLSDDVTLKIKAMAEGVICETAKEFRASLVNPFSARFLYSDSSPRGPTWTCVDDTVLKEKYYPSPMKKATRLGDGAKGLKLILLHNSNFRPMRA